MVQSFRRACSAWETCLNYLTAPIQRVRPRHPRRRAICRVRCRDTSFDFVDETNCSSAFVASEQ